ncbi:ABC1 kinase family protein [Algibacter luteus]|uniref:2-octaprenylphenol hydroxylase n=1 Tax=Algibacter luteus TaxID=1178825 RepID=A0A1M6ELG1_9FLAO|nr:AarF/ABC1/UbiB kinase family protein [Algibacter luteus]WJJ95280.1 AarF/ABC1/UbiB kinase family protein [Algibacter luteus]SHI86352.1 2-octaprenylphenol hydroxylase [Algibacter luteus]
MGVLTDIIKRFKSISRYNQIIRVLMKYGFDDLVHYLEENKNYTFIQKFIPNSTKKRVSKYGKWAKMRLVCEELGPTFVKFGQILSNRPDLVPLELTFELEKLQDNVPPMSESIARNVVETELKDKVENLFAWFEPTPFASASMAQVHKVTLHSGKRVALKIQRAGIYDVIIEDIKVMYRVANVLEKRIPSLKSFDPVGLVSNFEASILKELDFIHESINVQRFYNNLKNDDSLDQFAKAPKVYPEFTTTKVLALEFVSGIKIDKIEELKSKAIDTTVIARRLSISYFKQIFEYGFFHADPHPGNLLVLPNNHICYLDFGMMGSMLPRDISIFGKLFIAITNKDVKKIIKALQELSNNAPITNRRELEFDINEFVEKYYVRDVHENEMSTILLELKDIIIAHGLKVPTHFFLFARSLVTIEGVIEKLDPKLEQFEIVKPYLKKSATRKYNPLLMGKKIANSLVEFTDYMEELPQDLKNAIRKINSGQIKVDLTHKGIDPMVHTLQRITKQLITAFIMVALIVGASLFIIFEIQPLWKGISLLGISSFTLAIILGFGMLSNIRKGDYDY